MPVRQIVAQFRACSVRTMPPPIWTSDDSRRSSPTRSKSSSRRVQNSRRLWWLNDTKSRRICVAAGAPTRSSSSRLLQQSRLSRIASSGISLVAYTCWPHNMSPEMQAEPRTPRHRGRGRAFSGCFVRARPDARATRHCQPSSTKCRNAVRGDAEFPGVLPPWPRESNHPRERGARSGRLTGGASCAQTARAALAMHHNRWRRRQVAGLLFDAGRCLSRRCDARGYRSWALEPAPPSGDWRERWSHFQWHLLGVISSEAGPLFRDVLMPRWLEGVRVEDAPGGALCPRGRRHAACLRNVARTWICR